MIGIKVVPAMPQLEKAKVFMTGRSQAVRIPAQYRFKTDEVYIRHDARTGEITLSERPEQPSLTEIFKMLDEAVAAEGPLELDRDMRLPEEREWP
jgi:antitoxin VapB